MPTCTLIITGLASMFETEKIERKLNNLKGLFTQEGLELNWPVIIDALTIFGHETSILYWPCLISFFLLALFSYFYYQQKNSDVTLQKIFSFLFPRKSYVSKSALIDYQVFAINTVFFALPTNAIMAVGAACISVYVSGIFKQIFGDSVVGIWYWTPVVSFVFFFLIKVLIIDFINYWTHRWFHTNALLWPLHRLHHSAEALNPVTIHRKHPLFTFITSAIQTLVVGTITAIAFCIFVGKPNYYNMLGVSMVRAVFNLTGAALRHTHIWISYGPYISKILISPAQHQVHHSAKKIHLNKNFGEIFAVWDWLFGTLYIPHQKEELQFGLSKRSAPIHDTVLKAYFEPIHSYTLAIWGVIAKPMVGLSAFLLRHKT